MQVYEILGKWEVGRMGRMGNRGTVNQGQISGDGVTMRGNGNSRRGVNWVNWVLGWIVQGGLKMGSWLFHIKQTKACLINLLVVL
jgi:hypothetical protein